MTYANGSRVEVVFENPHPVENEVQVTCESTLEYPDACGVFELRKNETKSRPNRWHGTLRVVRRVNYLDKPLFQFVVLAKVAISDIS